MPARPAAYDADVEEMTSGALGTLDRLRTRLVAAGLPDAVAITDELAQELVDAQTNDDDHWPDTAVRAVTAGLPQPPSTGRRPATRAPW